MLLQQWAIYNLPGGSGPDLDLSAAIDNLSAPPGRWPEWVRLGLAAAAIVLLGVGIVVGLMLLLWRTG